MRRNNRATPKMLSRDELETAVIVAKRNANLAAKRTVAPTQSATVTETVTLESPKADVLSFAEGRKAARKARRERNRDMSWLAADVFSTPSAYRA